MKPELKERNERIIKKRGNGYSYAQIARTEGISIERVHQICTRKENKPDKEDFDGLSIRTYHCIRRAGIENKKQLFNALQCGIEIRNFGVESMKELEKFFGKKLEREKHSHIYEFTKTRYWVWSYKFLNETVLEDL